MAKETNTTEDTKELAGPSFWSRVLDLLFGVDKVDKQTKVRLNEITKKVQKSSFSSYYSSFTAKVNADFARYFYDIYRQTSSVQEFFNTSFDVEKSYNKILRDMMSMRQLEILDALEEDALWEKSKKVKYMELSKEVKSLLHEFNNEFTSERVEAINNIYSSLYILRSFCSFDYYALLRMFSPDLQEMNFKKKPHFGKVWGMYVAERLSDFESLLKALLSVKDWKSVFEFINNVSGKYVINVEEWSKLILSLSAHEEEPIFEMMCKLINSNPDLAINSSVQRKNIADLYAREVSERVITTIQSIHKEQKVALIRSDVKKLFPKGFHNQLKYYVDDLNQLFASKNLSGYENCDALAYLYAFLDDYSDELDEISANLNVYGKSIDKEFIADLLNCCKKFASFKEAIITFDGKLNPQLAQGFRFQNFLSQKIVGEQEYKTTKTQLDLCNAEAMKIIKSAYNTTIEIGNMCQKLYKDIQSDTKTLISNWKELDGRVATPYKQQLATILQAIANFQKLEKNFISN